MYELRFMKPAERYFKKLKEKGLKTAYMEALNKISADPLCSKTYKTKTSPFLIN